MGLSSRPRTLKRVVFPRPFTPTIDVLAVPDIDSSLNDSAAKREFWAAFKALGEWYDNLPPY